MTLSRTLTWEARLLDCAREGLEDSCIPMIVTLDTHLLDCAYQACAEITRRHSRTFSLASALLPADKRRAARALYAFCRISDDIVDRAGEGDPALALADWRRRAISPHPSDRDLVALAWADARLRFGIPVRYAEQLLDGVASDLRHRRFSSFDPLAVYAYGVASTVGLMAMHIIGFATRAAIPYAIRLGIALQLTNILRDVGEDWRRGRLYLPEDELARFGLCETDIAAGAVTPAWRAFMRYQIERTRALYAEARPGIFLLESEGRFAIAAAADLYEAILEDIEAHDYDVFNRRAHLTAWGKLRRLPAIWFKSRLTKNVTIWFDE